MDSFEILAVMSVVVAVLFLLRLREAMSQSGSYPCQSSTYGYFEAIKNDDPEEGIDYIVNYFGIRSGAVVPRICMTSFSQWRSALMGSVTPHGRRSANWISCRMRRVRECLGS